MPGGKMRLKGLFTGGLQVGSDGDYAKQVMSGSVSFECGSIGAGLEGSTVCEVVTILGLTASHILVAQVTSGNTCTILRQSVAGAGQASFHFSYLGACGGSAASQTTTKVVYLAF